MKSNEFGVMHSNDMTGKHTWCVMSEYPFRYCTYMRGKKGNKKSMFKKKNKEIKLIGIEKEG